MYHAFPVNHLIPLQAHRMFQINEESLFVYIDCLYDRRLLLNIL